MSFMSRKLQLLLGFTALLMLSLAAGCTGFFVNPTLSTVTVGPNPLNLTQGNKQQMTATGTFDDGSTKTLTSGVVWSSSDTTVAPVNASGTVTGSTAGTATITGTSGTVSGNATVNVTLGNVTNLAINPTTNSMTQTGSATFHALATVQGQSSTVDVSDTASWTASPTGLVQINNSAQPPAATVTYTGATLTSNITVMITATYNSNGTNFTANATLTVTP
jgi:trimeric autotransporter adhesin